MKRATTLILSVLLAIVCVGGQPTSSRTESGNKEPLYLADPFIFESDGVYYAYGTYDREGIAVYRSTDLKRWEGPCGASDKGLALHRNNSWGSRNFWAPEVYKIGGKYVMTYSAEEHTAVAFADSPVGPFKQTEPFEVYLPDYKNIDSHIFIDDGGQAYLYFVRFDLGRGNEIRCAKLSADLKTIVSEQTECLHAMRGTWEMAPDGGRVTEGPYVLKHKGIYYLTYSANDFHSQDYAVGYATADNPLGPWTRYEGNPVLHKHGGNYGTGHHSFLTTSKGKTYIVYHAHKDGDTVSPRKMLISPYGFVKQAGGPDKIVVGEKVIEPAVIKKY